MASRFKITLNIVEFNCGEARNLGFDTRDERDEIAPENLAHAHVYCELGPSRRKKQAKKLALACQSVAF